MSRRRIPLIDVSPLFEASRLEAGRIEGSRDARLPVDRAILEASEDFGFMILEGLPDTVPRGGAARDALFRLFELPPSSLRRLWRHAWAPGNPNVYRGFFPLSGGVIKHGMDIGPEAPVGRPGDALAEPTPRPAEADLPGWQQDVRQAFDALSRVGAVLMQAIARGLALPETYFDEAFRGGNSTLRLIIYPPWPEIARSHGLALRTVGGVEGPTRYEIGGAHVDSGFVTLLQQDAVGGLQARVAGEEWVDVPPVEGTLVVNFGRLLERWMGGRIRATEHRVLGNRVERHSIPFFYEPRIDARILPLPMDRAAAIEPFVYGDHLWESMTRFAEFAQARRWGPLGEGMP